MLKLAAATGALVPGISPQGKLPPRKPGDEDKIAKRLGQTSGSNVNGKRWLLHKDSILCYTNWQYTQTYTNIELLEGRHVQAAVVCNVYCIVQCISQES